MLIDAVPITFPFRNTIVLEEGRGGQQSPVRKFDKWRQKMELEAEQANENDRRFKLKKEVGALSTGYFTPILVRRK